MSDIELLRYRLIKTTRRLTFDIEYQHDRVTYMGDDDGEYFKFKASNDYEVISRSRMDIQTERIWLLGAKHLEESRSGSMVFSSNEKRDAAYEQFVIAIDEWARHNGGFARQMNDGPQASLQKNSIDLLGESDFKEIYENLCNTEGCSYQSMGREVQKQVLNRIFKC